MWRYRFFDLSRSSGPSAYASAPWATGLAAAHVELIALVPGTDINGALWSELEHGSGVSSIAALLCVDPFLRVSDRCALLRAGGITEIVNLPSVRLFEAETGRALDDTGYGWKRELDQLTRFKEAGFAVNVVVRDRAGAREALALRPHRLIVHPGLPPSESAARLVAMKRAVDLCHALASEGHPVSLYRPHGFDDAEHILRGWEAGCVALQFISP